MTKLTEEEKEALKIIIDEFELEDQATREQQIRKWKRLEYFWNGFTNIWWDTVAHDWRVYSYNDDASNGDNSSEYYDKSINVFRAFLETIIANLSVVVPPIKCYPDDADNVSDTLTAKGGTQIAELIYKHVDAPLLWIKGLWCYCLQGMVAGYNYTDEDKKYGTKEIPNYKDSEEEVDVRICPSCGTTLSGEQLGQTEKVDELEKNEFDPGSDDVESHDLLNKGQIICPQCLEQIDPEVRKEKVIVTRLDGTTVQPKSRQKIEVYGGLYVKVPNWARCQEEIPYLSYCYETHYSNVLAKFPKLREIGTDNNSRITSSDGGQIYERWGRLSPEYRGEYPMNTPTVRNWWLRPSAFEVLKDESVIASLKKKFPDGAKVIFVNDQFVEACPENLDDHWTLTFNPMSNSVHYDPIGALLTAVQEISSELISLSLQTIEHGIPQTFADPTVLNFQQYSNTEVTPGMVFPAKNKSGKNLGDGFYTVQTTSLSPEVGPFGEKINALGQQVSGALPSLSGGNLGSSSRTASQYAMSRNQAQQRLQIHWKIFLFWWKNIFGKSIPAYIKNMLEDEKLVQQQNGSFINAWIRKSQLDGKLGSIELEASADLPITVGQIRDTVMELLQTNNPAILEALGSAQNMPILSNVLGLSNFEIPGEADRQKQYEEIQLLINSNPISNGQQGGEAPSIQPEFDVDNHKIEAEICRDWLVSETGRQCKTENEQGYKNVLLHLQIHMQMLQQLMGAAPQQQAPPQNKPQLRPIPGGKANG